MNKLLKDIAAVIRENLKSLSIFVLIIVVVLIGIYSFASYETSNSEFCDSCHYMAPYVRHWESSTHAGVDCVACHDYTGGDLILSSVKYAAEVYNTRPQSRVLDENCLADGCHDIGSLDEDKKFKDNIFFQHSVHLDKVLRSGKLHCTSCHNQRHQNNSSEVMTHMTVNEQTCFVCHFKDAGEGESVTGCYSCHGSPKSEVEHAGFVFNHQPYLELNVECKQCHVKIVNGNADVSEDKCFYCHVERQRNDYSHTELHDIHVSNQGIDCQRCHDNIEHGNFQMVGALDIQCENCHLRQHNKPKQLYMGIGAVEDHEMPSEMFQAQVSCTGCHTHITPEGEILADQEKKEANRQSCVTCHGEGYDLMFDNWKSGSKIAMKDYKSYMNQAYTDFKSIGGNSKQRQKVQSAYTKMKENYTLVSEGHMVHNIQYSVHMLNTSANNFEQAMHEISKSYKAPSRGDAFAPDKSCQTFCHGNAFFPEMVTYDGSDLPHEMHVTEMELSCASCHSTEKHGVTKINDSVCAECH